MMCCWEDHTLSMFYNTRAHEYTKRDLCRERERERESAPDDWLRRTGKKETPAALDVFFFSHSSPEPQDSNTIKPCETVYTCERTRPNRTKHFSASADLFVLYEVGPSRGRPGPSILSLQEPVEKTVFGLSTNFAEREETKKFLL